MSPKDVRDLLLKVTHHEHTNATEVLAMTIMKVSLLCFSSSSESYTVIIMQELGHFALAVVQAGMYIFRSGCGIGPYPQLYQTCRSNLLEEYCDYTHKMDGYEWTVYMTWQLSFEQLRTHSAQAARFLQLCAFLHHDGISQAIFQNAAVNIESFADNQESNSLSNAKDFLDLFLTSAAWDTWKFLKIVSEIRSYSLIDFDDKAEVYSIHPLVRDWICVTMSHRKATCASTQCILGMSVSWKFESENYSFRQTLLPHIDVVLQGGTATRPDLNARLVYTYSEAGRWKEAENLWLLVMEMRKRVLGEEHPELLMSMANLVLTYRNQG